MIASAPTTAFVQLFAWRSPDGHPSAAASSLPSAHQAIEAASDNRFHDWDGRGHPHGFPAHSPSAFDNRLPIPIHPRGPGQDAGFGSAAANFPGAPGAEDFADWNDPFAPSPHHPGMGAAQATPYLPMEYRLGVEIGNPGKTSLPFHEIRLEIRPPFGQTLALTRRQEGERMATRYALLGSGPDRTEEDQPTREIILEPGARRHFLFGTTSYTGPLIEHAHGNPLALTCGIFHLGSPLCPPLRVPLPLPGELPRFDPDRWKPEHRHTIPAVARHLPPPSPERN